MDFQPDLFCQSGLSPQAAGVLMHHAERIEAGKKQVILAEGSRDEWVYFVERGSLRTYAMREERCVILSFCFEGDTASSELGLPDSEIARYYIETMEPSTLLRIPRTQMEALFATSVELANWGRRLAEKRLRALDEYFADFCWREKGDQYLSILEKYPELLLRVPLKDLASYLYVTPQSLSRIRATLK